MKMRTDKYWAFFQHAFSKFGYIDYPDIPK